MTEETLQSMIMIIDAGAERGAFKGPELAAVATVRAIIEAELLQMREEPDGSDET